MKLGEGGKRARCYKSGFNVLPNQVAHGAEMDGSLPAPGSSAGRTPLNGPVLLMAPRRIHYSQRQNFNAVTTVAEVRTVL